jgi:hypothetical protein
MKKKLLLIGNVLGAIIIFIYIISLKNFFSDIIKTIYKSINDFTSQNNSSSISIIGGADGPTAIFVTGNSSGFDSSLFLILPLILVNIILVVNIIFLYRNHIDNQTRKRATKI